jgi:hypothetical protein
VPVFVVFVVFTDASAVGANVCVAVAAVVPPGSADAASVTPATVIAVISVFARIAVNKEPPAGSMFRASSAVVGFRVGVRDREPFGRTVRSEPVIYVCGR